MIEDHQRRRVGAQVLDAVVDVEAALAEDHGDLAGHLQAVAEHDVLAHAAAHAQDVLLPLPAAAGVHVLGRDVGEPPVEAQLLVLLLGIDLGVADEGETAGRQQAEEGAPHPAVAWRLVEGRPHVSRLRPEAQGHPLVVGRGDVQGAAREHRETEAGGVEELHQPGAALVALHQLGPADAGHLAHVPHEILHLPPAVSAAE